MERRSRGTPVRVRNLNGTQGTCGDRMRGLNCRIDHKTNALKKTCHPGSELRFAPVLAIICHHRFPGFHFLFCCYTGVPFAYAHSTACLTSVAPTGLKVRRACARGNTHFSSRLRVSLHSLATPWLAPTAHANVRCHSLERLGLTPLHANARCRSRERSA